MPLTVWRATQAVLQDKRLVEAFRAVAEQPVQPADKEFADIYEAARKQAGYSLHPATTIVNALAAVAGADGVIDDGDLKKLGGRFSPLGLQLAAKARTARAVPGPEMASLLTWSLSTEAKQALAKTTESLAALETMPVLASLLADVEANQPLKGHRLFAVQHLFSSTFGLFQALERAGIEAKGSMVFGKDYSTNVEVALALTDRGFTVVEHYGRKEPVVDNNRIVGLASPLLTGLRTALAEAAAHNPPQRLLLLDEGGKLNRMLHDVFPEQAHLCTIVEQTTNGLQNMAGVTLRAPAVSVAASQLKRDVEGPIIGEDVAATTLEQLTRLDPGLAAGKTVGIVGYGAVGSATAQAFAKRGFTVVVTDTDPHAEGRAAVAQRAAFDGGGSISVKPRHEVLGAGIVVGCTGTGACTIDELRFVKGGAVLVNAASGDHEFPTFDTDAARAQGVNADRFEMRDWQKQFDRAAADAATTAHRPIVTFTGLPVPVTVPKHGESETLISFPRGDGSTFEAALNSARSNQLANQYFAQGDRSFVVLRGGTPINMERDLPPASIQLTRSMLFAACIQAVGEKEPGWQTFAQSTQQVIESRWRASNSSRA